MTIEVRLISTDSDYQKVVTIRREVFVQEQQVPEEIEIDEFEKSSDHFLVLVDQVPAGCGRMRCKNQYIKFERIAIRKTFRGTGLGRALMLEMLKHARQKYPHSIPYMHSQLEAVPFYQKLGWSPKGEVFFEAGIPHRTMLLERK